jgi:endothelin-converting enzyme/putative endopeptidase
MRLKVLLAVSVAALLVSCKPSEAPPTPAPAASMTPAKAALGEFGIDLAQVDTSVKPGDDFFRYVNGKWLASFKMPADKSSFGSFDRLGDQAEADVHGILDDLQKTPPPAGGTPAKVADLYASWMDEAAVEARGVEPLKPYLARVAAAATKADIVKLMADPDLVAPVSLAIEADPDDPTKYAVWIGQGGLGMPNRDYYLKKGATFDKYRAAYKDYATKVFTLLGDPKPADSAAKLIALETKIANVQWAPERTRNVKEDINPMDVAKFQALAPAIDWKVVLTGYSVGDIKRIVVGEPSALTETAKLIANEPIDAWKTYLTFGTARSASQYLTKAFDDARFEFYGKTLQGMETKRERWKRGIALVNSRIGEGAGEIYVQKYFPPENKAKMDALVTNLLAALRTRIEKLDWMDEPTRAEALKKLGTFEPRVGYPKTFRDYSALQIDRGKLFENILAAQHFDWARQVKRLGGKVDRNEWGMVPQEVNAYYHPLMNQITFPAAILQPPFFDPNADPAVNYGAIGAIIGHEIGHGFDDQGREFDETGKIRNWWSKDTSAKFVKATKMLGAQYDKYCPVADACVKGALTMGENIDLGGIQMAYTAYHLSLGGKDAPVIDNLTGDQRFFMAYAQAWKEMLRDDFVRQQVMTDPHSPGQYRANGVVRNVDAWYEAFGVKEGDKLYLKPEERVHIW